MVLLAGLLVTGVGAVYALPLLSPAALLRFAEYYADLLFVALVIVAIRHGLSRVAVREQRHFWHRLTAAFAFWLAADAIYASSPGQQLGPPSSVLADCFYFCFYLLFLLALEQRVHLGAHWREQVQPHRYAIAGSLVVLVAALCYAVVIPLWLSPPAYESSVPSFLLFVVLDAVLVFRLVAMAHESRSSPWRWIYLPLAVAALLWAVADTLDGLYYAGVFTVGSGTLLDVLWYAPFLFVVLATRVRNHAAGSLAPVIGAPTARPSRRLVPGLLVAYAFVVPLLHFAVYALGWGDTQSRPARDVVVLLGLLSLCGLALAQELAMRRRNRELRRRLDDLLTDERLEAVQRLESLGVLAGGIAHDFNNLLVGILGNADLVLHQPSLSGEAQEKVKQIRWAAQQAADLTAQMLTYAGRGQFTLQPQDLNAVVAETAELLGAVISKKADLRCRWARQLPPVAVDAVQIRQLTMNLLTNASEALADGPGKLTLATDIVDADRAALDRMQLGSEVEAGRFVALTVSDTGSGMSERTRERMFDPFFSTKFPGRGLGLAAVLGIVRSHGGALEVASELGAGTTVRVLLPALPQPTVTASRGGEAAAEWPGGDLGTALVIDDEAPVRSVIGAMLGMLGFEVLEAGDGEQGLAAFRDRRREITAVLLDLTMPVMDGAETLAEMQRREPEPPVVLMSGYDEERTRQRCGGLGARAFLRKPFQFEDLRQALRPLLKTRQRGS